jgi:UDP-N-acetylmuramate dehydrogenase
VATVRELEGKFKFDGIARRSEPMSRHTSFKIGGAADLYLAPRSVAEVAEITATCARESLPCFLLGGGTNILVSDKGIRGVVVDLSGLAGCDVDGDVVGDVDATLVSARCGTPISEVAERARDRGLSGLEFAYSLPGSVGGAVWMNARCYDRQMSDVLEYVQLMDRQGVVRREGIDPAQWAYKRSPFQADGRVILTAGLRLAPGNRNAISAAMEEHRADRVRKGHFLHPCAGSIFKNNRAFGAPTGKIIDSLGLKGRQIGDAQIAPFHGNIIINTGNATAREVLSLILLMEEEVEKKLGLRLEREVILVGEW